MIGMWLTLSLLVTCIFANDAHYIFSLHDAAAFAKSLY